jgi:amino acid adenylation domain-containing protein
MAEDSGKAQNSALDAWLKRKKKNPATKGITPIPEGESAPLSYGQERLWLLEQLYPDQNLYHYAQRYRLKGKVSMEALTDSFQKLARKHKILRSYYQQGEAHAAQATEQPLSVTHFDFSEVPDQQQAKQVEDNISKLVKIPFKLEEGGLFRLYTFRLSESGFELLIVMHHIIGDAWSMGLINEEAGGIYTLLQSGGGPSEEAALKIQYEDYAYWQRKKPVKEADLAYWKEQLSGELPVLSLPKTANLSAGSFEGRSFKKLLGTGLNNQLRQLASSQGTTMYVLMLAAFKVLLSKYSQQDDVIVGSPFSNRDTPELEKLIGFFNETLVLRTRIDNVGSFTSLVSQVRELTIDALAHKHVPFDLLVNELKPARQAGENPLFQTMFLYNAAGKKLDLGPDIAIDEEMLDLHVSKFELTLFVNEVEGGLELAFEYLSSIDSEIIEAMASHFEALLLEVVKEPDKPIGQLSLYSQKMQDELAKKWHGKKADLPVWKSIHELIGTHIKKQPASTAVVFGNDQLTYAELDSWSDQVAGQLADQEVDSNEFVGLYTPRSLEMVVGILGILKAGAAYLPLDPDYPKERLEFMIADTRARVIVHHPDFIYEQAPKGIVELALTRESVSKEVKPIEIRHNPDDYAYVIYTSGSTGKPKGVPVTHRNLLHSTTARFDFFEDEMSSFLLLSSFSFDSSIVGIFWSLCAGGSLVLPPKRIEQDLAALTDIIARESVTHTLMLPSLYQVLLSFSEQEKLSALGAVMVAGEACSPGLKSLHFEKLPTTRLYNEYGPTEASVWCIAHEITASDDIIPIGRPIQNTSAYILDQNLQPVPTGMAGELYIGGAGVTQGYLNRPELTKERFLANPNSSEKDIIYKTGDLARFRSDGTILFLGRADTQVKIRGFRVEPEEVRNSILAEPHIAEAIVQVLEDDAGNKQLIAWIQSTEEAMEVRLRQKLKSSLPEYMVPSAIVVMDHMPKLPNGKVDGTKLPAPTKTNTDHSAYSAPENEIEKALVDLWQQVLSAEKVGIDDNFFDIGGDSILSIQIVARSRQAGLKVGPADIFKYQDIRSLAAHVGQLGVNEKSVQAPDKEDYPIQFALSYQQQAFLFHHLQSKQDQGLLQLEFHISGNIDTGSMAAAWQKATTLHPVMRTSVHWQDNDAAYQIIHEQAKLSWSVLDFSDEPEDQRIKLLDEFRTEDKATPLDLTKPGGGRITLIKTDNSRFLLCWTCHHILIDGWSGAIIFKDALALYQGQTGTQDVLPQPVPNYRQFLNWKVEQDDTNSKHYWQQMLGDSNVPLFSEQRQRGPSADGFADVTIHIEEGRVGTFNKKVQEERLTANTALQGLWMLTMSSYFGAPEVATGLTVTGRSVDFPGIDRITGLMMNVLPFTQKLQPSETLGPWLLKLQSSLNELRRFEHTDPDQIQAWIGKGNRAFFDNLFVFGNFMAENIELGDLEVGAYKGDFSATYPVTLRINPGTGFEINCRIDTSVVSEESAKWLVETYESLFLELIQEEGLQSPIQSLLKEKPVHLFSDSEQSTENRKDSLSNFSTVENTTQLTLLKLWERLTGQQLIGIHDNYFEIGGTSVGAIQLFSEIAKVFGVKLSPTELIKRPTVALLSELLSSDAEQAWSSIIPMKTSGSKAPLFCLHSGGAHILFYQGLARHLSADRPVYAIQPTGIDGEQEHHSSIAEMTSHYIDEMQKIQPEGPYHLIGTCFGNAVGVEMAHQLKERGEEIAVLYVVDSAPAYLEPPSPNGERKPVSRMMAMIKDGNWRGIVKKFRNRYIRLDKKMKAHTRSEQEIELDEIIDTLNDVYVNYTWKPVSNRVVLIRSTEFSQRKDKAFHLKRWQQLAGQHLEVCEVEGHHLTLFDEPEVKGLTKAIEEHLS